MDLDDSLRSVGTILSQRPADVLPIYLVATAVAATTQSVVFLGVVLAYLSLRGSGRIEAVLDAVEETTGAQPSGSEELIDSDGVEPVAEAFIGLLTPTVLVVLGATVVAALLVYVVARAVTAAAAIHATAGALRGSLGTTEGVVGAIRDWKRFLVLQLLRGIALWLPGVGLLALRVAGAPTFVLALGALAWLLVAVVVYVTFLFAPQAVVVDDVGPLRAVRRGVGFVRRNVLSTAVFLVVLLGSAVAVGVVAGVLSVLGVSAASGLFVLFLFTPAIGLLKTGLYLDEPPATHRSTDGYLRSVGRAFRRGVHALRSFVTRRLADVLVMHGVFGASMLGGWVAMRPYAFEGLTAEGLDPAAVFGAFPVDTFFNLAANNWQVSIGTAYAGLGLGLPSILTVAFNGALVGALGGLFGDPVLFAAFIVPHGLVEIPALATAGAFGLHLGRTVWGYVRGRRTVEDVAGEIRGTYYALLGLLPVFLVAAFVEAFVTPAVAALFA